MEKDALQHDSRRSPVVCTHGCVVCAQPLAGQIGIDVLKAGGNAADAAVAVAAAMNVTQPTSTGIGGDAFCLYYDAQTKKVLGLNGSGRSPSTLTAEHIQQEGFNEDNPIPVNHGHSVTVPGAAAAWVDTVERFGSKKLSMEQILTPAIDMAENGFPVSQVAAVMWDAGSHLFRVGKNTDGKDFLINGRAPKWGEIMKLPALAKTFKELVAKGKEGFYKGRIAEAIVDVVQKFGGLMSLEDLASHETTFDEPIYVDYKGVRAWQMPPNGQGITALMALNILEEFDLKSMGHNTAPYLHTLIEALRLSFADSLSYNADPSCVHVPVKGMLAKDYAAKRRNLMCKDKVMPECLRGSPEMCSDTVYFSVVDSQGNACSFINSNYQGFGTGLVPEGCGFTLHNRGLNFSYEPSHPNVIGPSKRPYHTIIPAIVTSPDTGELLMNYGVMGRFMQPQGQVQVLLNMLEFGMNPQEALNKPRFCIDPLTKGAVSPVSFEDGVPDPVLQQLKAMGHEIKGPVYGYDRFLFGRGHVITRGAWWADDKSGDIADDSSVLWAGTDPRADGIPIGF
ncbi:uncharacterized protein LOC106156026 [Lingula anatina]|uniref:Uncharacterized protein LOC106156026 n=1 Tax=Lingula anatina TaxID=7574 RepID=A0A1S3HM33_LINAN|nr:uncharacterized protein LOC106156026 [Lingula anatina]|eukprot:XP_013386546.1 uncharacterized protein LOC106156026 [Lingula anatina]